jgi:hypothetical protein
VPARHRIPSPAEAADLGRDCGGMAALNRTWIAAFWSERAMFESNVPPNKGQCSYPVVFNLQRINAGCSEAGKTALFFGTAARVPMLVRACSHRFCVASASEELKARRSSETNHARDPANVNGRPR